ncbi:MAG: hypothetical protein JNM79_20220 [Burkholderiales bacterium]|nr:hypothetical protein [Burkholderiales bacterium]
MLLLKLAAAPAVVWLASQAGRRWGHRVAGLIGGFPLIAAPLVLFIALEAPGDFVGEVAWLTMAAAPGVAVHCVVFAWFAHAGFHWSLCLAAAWTACVAAAVLLTGLIPHGFIGFALVLGIGLALTAAIPRPRGRASLTAIPDFEIAVRMAAALALAAVIMFGAQTLGARASGVLLGFPITASVLPVFTLHLHGAEATIRLLSGFSTGLLGFGTYFFAFASLIEEHGAWLAAAAGVAACVTTVSSVLRFQSWRRGMAA